ncbi:SH3 domain-containing protein [Roseibium sp.]|uniref:SH3 domain-containing protein n=1 Tax=Roseibium sp. TaxID=1936156 RepID=UPI003B51CFEE
MYRLFFILLMSVVLYGPVATASAQNAFPQQGISYGGKVRAGPGLQYGQIGSLRDGDRIRIVGATGVMMDGYEWFQIRYRNGRTGFQWGGLMCSQRPYPTIYKTCPNLGQVNPAPGPGNGLTIVGDPNVTGKNVASVSYPGGVFKQVGYREWHETGPRGRVRYTFIEKSRDQWSVYLHDASRNVSIQLDLHRRKILIGLASAPNTPIYDIVNMAANPNLIKNPGIGGPTTGTNGFTLSRAGYPGGRFIMKTNGRWHQTGPNGAVQYGYQETNRDQHSVFLLDRSRNVSVKLDLRNNRILFGIGNGPMAEMAKITSKQ